MIYTFSNSNLLVPEGLPSIVTIMLSIGVKRMAKKNAVIRKLPAVETLGNASIICSDKTGTLTQNKMTVKKIASINGNEAFSSKLSELILTLSCLCNDATIQISNKELISHGEPTEQSLVICAYKNNINKSRLDLLYKRIYEIPFDSSRKLMTTVHLFEGQYRIVTKGAPDILISKCTQYFDGNKVLPLTNYKKQLIKNECSVMAQDALRTISVAYKDTSSNPNSKSDSEIENGLIFVGIAGIIDPPRPEVKEAVVTCKLAGIKPIMITGDHIDTACAIAKELGILSDEKAAISGSELSLMSEKELYNNIYNYSVFARVSPKHKVRIVKAFQGHNEIVAMTGDGVNDAPALKCADIGCAMGISGTDVAKNAADMILTDDNFSTIVCAVKEGRCIYDNIRRSIHFLLSSNIGEILTIFVAILFGLPTPLLAVQLLFINLITDSLPAISLGVEAPSKNIMKRSPLKSSQSIFDNGLAFQIIFEGFLIGCLSLISFIIGIKFFDNTDNYYIARTMSFAVLGMSQLFHSFNMRSEYSIFKIGIFSNIQLVISFIICIIMQICVISLEPLAKIFKLSPLNATQWYIVIILSIVPIIIVELQKAINSKQKTL